MSWKEFFDFLKYIITIAAIVFVVVVVLNSGFMLKTFKLDYKDLINIELSGYKVSEYEKNTQPR